MSTCRSPTEAPVGSPSVAPGSPLGWPPARAFEANSLAHVWAAPSSSVTPVVLAEAANALTEPAASSVPLSLPITAVPRGHLVQFYESDEYLIDMVGTYVLEGLAREEGVVLIMSHAHLQELLAFLHHAGLNVTKKIDEAHLVMFDADFMLQQISVWSSDDSGRVQMQLLEAHFHQLVSDAVTHVTQRESDPPRHVRMYGELVNILVSRGHIDEAIELERLWNAAAENHVFTLLCGYHIRNLNMQDMSVLPCDAAQPGPAYSNVRRVCDHHAHSHMGDVVQTVDDACDVVQAALEAVPSLLPFALVYLPEAPEGAARRQGESAAEPVLYRRIAIGFDSDDMQEATSAVWKHALAPAVLRPQVDASVQNPESGVPFISGAEASKRGRGFEAAAAAAIRHGKPIVAQFSATAAQQSPNPPALVRNLCDGRTSAMVFPLSADGDVPGCIILGVLTQAEVTHQTQYNLFIRLMAAQVANYLRLTMAFQRRSAQMQMHLRSPASAASAPQSPARGEGSSVPSRHRVALDLLSQQLQQIVELPAGSSSESSTRQRRMRRLHKLLRLSAPDALTSLQFERAALGPLTAAIVRDNEWPVPVEVDSSALPLMADTYIDVSRFEEVVLGLVEHAAVWTARASRDDAAAKVHVTLRLQPDCHCVQLQVSASTQTSQRRASLEPGGSAALGADLLWVQDCTELHGGFLEYTAGSTAAGICTATFPLGQRHLPAHRVKHSSNIHTYGPTSDDAGSVSDPALSAPAQAASIVRAWSADSSASPQTNASTEPHQREHAARSIAPTEWRGVPLLLLARPSAERAALQEQLSQHWSVVCLDDGASLTRMTTGLEATGQIPALIVVDSRALEDQRAVRELKHNERTSHMAVLQLLNADDEAATVSTDSSAFLADPYADDSITKPVSSRDLLTRVRIGIELSRLRSSLHRQVELQTQHLLGAHAAHVGAIRLVEQQQRARAEEAERHETVASQLNDENCRLYSVLQQSYASLEATVEQRTAELRQKNAELEAAKQAAEEARAIAEKATLSKSDFLSNMSHELRTPLNAVLGGSRLLQGTTLDSEQSQFLSIITHSGHLLLTIINDILDYSKIEAGQLRLEAVRTRLSDAVETAVHLCEPAAAAKNIDLAFDLLAVDAPTHFLLDSVRLQQILLNLLSNATKFTARGGVHVSVECQAVDSGSLDCSSHTPLYELTFTVADTGIGIKEDDMKKLFQSFSQAKDIAARFGGTGLGLVISKRLCEAMGGYIRCSSVVNVGSTFKFAIRVPAIVESVDRQEGQENHGHGDDGAIAPHTPNFMCAHPAGSSLNPFSLTVAECTALRSSRIVIASRTPRCGSVSAWARLLGQYGSHVHVEGGEVTPVALTDAHRSSSLCVILHGMQELLALSGNDAVHRLQDLTSSSPLFTVLAPFSPMHVLILLPCSDTEVSTIGLPNSLRQPSSPQSGSSDDSSKIAEWPPRQRSRASSQDLTLLDTDVSHSISGGEALIAHITAALTHERAIVGTQGEPARISASIPVAVQMAPLRQQDLLKTCAAMARTLHSAAESREVPTLLPSPPPRHGSRGESTAHMRSPAIKPRSSAVMGHASSSDTGSRSGRVAITDLASSCPLRILLVEDNLINQKMMRMMLKKLGYGILVATNGEECLRVLEQQQQHNDAEQQINCVLMDANMDIMDGLQCAREIRRRQQDHHVVPYIIAQTANASEEFREKCMRAHMQDFLAKPINLDALVRALQKAYHTLHHDEQA